MVKLRGFWHGTAIEGTHPRFHRCRRLWAAITVISNPITIFIAQAGFVWRTAKQGAFPFRAFSLIITHNTQTLCRIFKHSYLVFFAASYAAGCRRALCYLALVILADTSTVLSSFV